MASARTAWGIDVGNRALKAVKLVRSGDGVKIDDVDIIEHEHILSNSGDNREQLIQASLGAFMQRHGARGVPVAVGVSGQTSFARFIKLPPVEPKKIPEIVRFEAIQQIPFPLDEVEWSYQLFREEGSPDVEVGIFAMRKELVSSYVKYFTGAGMNVQVVQTNPLAVYNAMQHDGKLNDGATLIIDLGAEHTDLIIAEGEQIWLRPIPIGGNNFTETLTKAFKLRFEKAEELKRNAATSKYGRQILQAMRPVFSDLVSEIQRSLGFYASVHRESKISKVIALGGTFRLPGLQKYLQQNLQLDVQRVEKLDGAPPADGQAAAMLDENVLSCASAYGLALQAMGVAKIESSLLPSEIRRERMWKDKTKWFIAGAAAAVVGFVAVPLAKLYLDRAQYDSAAADRNKVEATLTQAKQLASEWTEVQDAGKTEREQIQAILNLTKSRDFWAPLTAALTSALPKPAANIQTTDVDAIKKVPRQDRKIVWVDEWAAQYTPDIKPYLRAPQKDFIALAQPRGQAQQVSAGQPLRPPDPIGAAEDLANALENKTDAESLKTTQRGFIITMWCTTPSRDYQNIALQIVQDMKRTGALPGGKVAPPTGMKFRIERVELNRADKISRDSGAGGAGSTVMLQPRQVDPRSLDVLEAEAANRIQAAASGAATQPSAASNGQPVPPATQPAVPGAPSPNALALNSDEQMREMPDINGLFGPAAPEPGEALPADFDPAYVDPITRESTKNDYEMQFIIAVSLEPAAPTTKPAAKEGETPSDATKQQTASADASH